ncbi:hypothetical protein ACIPL1_21840 [Pseudomonas sp. NPDC090202]|uniref:hypothetical protein n=1 Tax=unclassified Pseudomonas TaxID=196821 RepID=UPI0037F5F846
MTSSSLRPSAPMLEPHRGAAVSGFDTALPVRPAHTFFHAEWLPDDRQLCFLRGFLLWGKIGANSNGNDVVSASGNEVLIIEDGLPSGIGGQTCLR